MPFIYFGENSDIVEIKESKISGAGQGLFAKKKIKKGDFICWYYGVYVDRAMVGQAGGTMPYTPVSLADQKRAFNALKKYVFAPNAFKAPKDLYNYLARQRRGFNLRIQYTQEQSGYTLKHGISI